jgi:hypothetical protein
MKKVLLAAVAVTAFAIGAGAGPVSAAPGFNASKWCSANADFGFGHGDCVKIVTKLVNKSGNDDAVALCQDFKLEFPDDFDANFKNLGECVNSLK